MTKRPQRGGIKARCKCGKCQRCRANATMRKRRNRGFAYLNGDQSLEMQVWIEMKYIRRELFGPDGNLRSSLGWTETYADQWTTAGKKGTASRYSQLSGEEAGASEDCGAYVGSVA